MSGVVEVAGSESSFAYAARRAGVVWAGLFALGIGFGVLVISKGLPWWLAPLISGTLFAGSVEFLFIGLLAAGAPLASIALVTFLVNARHLFYGLSYPLDLVKGRWAKAYAIFALCDEAFALVGSAPRGELTTGRILWIHAGLHVSWALGGLTGGLVGGALLSNVRGLDFILTALFVVLTMDAWRESRDPVTLGLAVVAGVGAQVVAPGSMLLVAMSAFTAALVGRHLLGRRALREEDGRA